VVHTPPLVGRWEAFWPPEAEAPSRRNSPLEAEPVQWRRLSDGQLFKSAGWQLELMNASPELSEAGRSSSSSSSSSSGSSGSKDGGALAKVNDADELPWQVVALMNPQSLGEYVDRWRDHDNEVFAIACWMHVLVVLLSLLLASG